MQTAVALRSHLARSRDSVRRFSLLDAMVLIAATAAGLAIDRAVWSDNPIFTARDFRDLTVNGIILSVPVALTWTVATLVLQLRHPRSRLRRLLRQPGMSACCAATSALVLGCVLIACAMQRSSGSFESRLIMGFGLPMMAGSAVIAVWTRSALVEKYKAASDWRDRLGRLIGLYWITSVLALGWTLAC